MTVQLENDSLRVAVVPDFGCRVTQLTSVASGRDWIAPGPQAGDVSEHAVYGGEQGVGWDECFPTVSPWDASATAWRRPLRDHGDLWGRPWRLEGCDGHSLSAVFETKDYRFGRRLDLDGPVLAATYTLTNRSLRDLPFLWAQHGLLAGRPGDRLQLGTTSRAAATYFRSLGTERPPGPLNWPLDAAAPFDLSQVQPREAAFAAKLYVEDIQRASIMDDREVVEFSWSGQHHLGLWLNYGGWPEGCPVHHLAIEPTSAPHDHLGAALNAGSAVILPSGGTLEWATAIAIFPRTDRDHDD